MLLRRCLENHNFQVCVLANVPFDATAIRSMPAVTLVSMKRRSSYDDSLDLLARFRIDFPKAECGAWPFEDRYGMAVVEMEVVDSEVEINGSLESTVEGVLVVLQCKFPCFLIDM